jgi:Fic family protein
MKYKSLLQLFYEGKTDEYNNRIENAKNDNCYFELPIKIGEYQAFFFLLPENYELIIDIIKTSEKIKAESPSWSFAALIHGFLIDEIVTTNNIEGVYSSRRDVSDVITGASKNSRLQGLVNRYSMLFSKKGIPVFESKDIRVIFDELVSKEVEAADKDHVPDGEIFRKSRVDVAKPGGRIIHNGVNPESEIIKTMDIALDFLNNAELNVFIKIAVFHYLFGYIHPFYDGNGRVDRFISSYLLSRETTPLLGYRLSYTINNCKSDYYKAFEAVNDFRGKGDITPFICTFLNIVKKALLDLSETISKLQIDLKHYQELIGKITQLTKKTAGLYRILLEASFFSDDGFTKKDIEQSLVLSAPTIKRRLKEIPNDIISVTTIKKQKYYKLNLKKILELSGEH